MQRSHREVAAALHCGVDRIARCNAVFKQLDCVVEIGEEERVHDEAGAIGNFNWVLTACLCECSDCGDGCVVGCHRANDFNKTHCGRWIEEVNAAHLTRTVGGHGHLDDRECRSIRGDDGVGLDDAIEFTEQRQFHIKVFDD